MKRRHFLATVPGVALISCAREEKRGQRYDPNECPFCTTAKGICSYCRGTKKCQFCNGKGMRVTVIPDLPEKGIAKSQYEETCPFCGGKGECTYCLGKGSCRVCNGTGRVESWDFYKD